MVAVGRGYLLAPDPPALKGFMRPRRNSRPPSKPSTIRACPPRTRPPRANETVGPAISSDVRSVIETDEEHHGQRAAMLRDRLLPARDDLGARLEELVGHKKELQDAARRAARRMDTHTLVLTGGLGTAGVFLSVLLAWGFTKHLSQIYAREQEAAARARRRPRRRRTCSASSLTIFARRWAPSFSTRRSSTERPPNRDARHAESIAAIATRMEAFIQTLLDAASIEAGRLVVSWKRCTVAEVLATTMETFAARDAKIGEARAGDRPPGLGFWGDPERIGQVLSNLVGNALKFTPEGGRIAIRAVESGFHTRIEVRDTGPGIASQHLPRVFERFWKAEAEGRKGTGLGLYIAKGIVERHRGRIWVESRVGAGSAFIFELPIAPPPEADTPSARGPPDDDRRTTARTTGPGRGTWRTSSSLRTTLKLPRPWQSCWPGRDIGREPPPMASKGYEGSPKGSRPILLDLEMPILDGPGMAEALALQRVGQPRIPIVLVSGAKKPPEDCRLGGHRPLPQEARQR